MEGDAQRDAVLRCDACNVPQRLPSTARAWTCDTCDSAWVRPDCPHCSVAFDFMLDRTNSCPNCGKIVTLDARFAVPLLVRSVQTTRACGPSPNEVIRSTAARPPSGPARPVANTLRSMIRSASSTTDHSRGLEKVFATINSHRLFFWCAAFVALGGLATTPLAPALVWIVCGGFLWWVVKAMGRGWRDVWKFGSGKHVRKPG